MPTDPWAVNPAKSSDKHFVMPPLNNLGDLLDFQRAAAQEAIFHKGTSDANRAELRKMLSFMPPGSAGVQNIPIQTFLAYGAQNYNKMPHVLQGLYDMAIDTMTDPLTYESLDTGALAKLGLKILKPGLNALDKAHIPVWGPGVVSDLNKAFTKMLNFGGEAIHNLGRSATNTAIGMLNRSASEEKEIFRRLQEIDSRAMAGLTDKQKSAVQKIMHGQVPASLVNDPAVTRAVQARRELTNNIIRLQQSETPQGLETILGRRFVTTHGGDALANENRFIPFGERSPANPKYAGTPRDLTEVQGASPFLHDSAGRLLTDQGVPIRRPQRYVKTATGQWKPVPRAPVTPRNLRVTHMAPQRRLPYLPELEPFVGRPGQFTRENYRPDYFPARAQSLEVATDRPASEINLLRQGNPHAKPQDEFHIPSRHVQHFEDAFQGMLKASARAISANRVRQELSKIYGGLNKIPPELEKILTVQIPAKGSARNVGQKAAESVKALVGLPKIGIVGTTPIHMFNILALLAAHAPEQIPQAALHFWNIAKAGGDELKRFQAMLPAIERGIDVSTHEKGGTFLSRMPLNRWTWDWDTAAKQALSDRYVREGLSPLDAGVRATNDIVNYRNTSPLTGFLRWAMPFATFAEGGAKSVLAAVGKNPELVETINRATGGAFLGGGHHDTDVTLYQPPADVGRGPATYLRSKTSDLLKLPVAAAVGSLPGGARVENWMLSGRTPAATALDIATGPIPYARTVLNMLPLPGGKNARGYEPDSPLNAAVFSSTGISLPSKPKKVTATTSAVDPHDPWAVHSSGAPTAPAPAASADPWAIHP